MNEYYDANHALPYLCKSVLENGDPVESRNGLTKEVIMTQFSLANPDNPYITVPGRKVSLPAQIAEVMWILAGRNDIEWLSHYLPRAAQFSDDGKHWRGGYGPRLRSFGGTFEGIDQLKHVVELLKADPETRRAVFQIYDPSIDTEPGKDIPCNNWVHFLPREGVLHAHVAIRSNDLFWGWSGINAFEWTILTEVVAALSGLERGSLTFSISSLHLYDHKWDRAAALAKQVGRPEQAHTESPKFQYSGTVGQFDALVGEWFKVEGQIRKGGISSALLHQIDTFPEPMFRSWLRVLLAWHHDDIQGLAGMHSGTALYAALEASPKRQTEGTKLRDRTLENAQKDFTVFADKLHREKHAAYGNSWKKRGEMLGIMANMARKIDRLGVAGGGDTAADTAIDLLMYAIKYQLWLDEQKHLDWKGITDGDIHADEVTKALESLAKKTLSVASQADLIAKVHEVFDRLEQEVTDKTYDRNLTVAQLIAWVYPLAVRLWKQEQLEKAKATVAELNAVRPFNGYDV